MRGDNDEVTSDWVRYWRSPDRPLEAMYAHFERHVYHRHSHESYSFGVTEQGAQAFTCRGGAHTSAAGMVMAFNPDDPHDGHAADDSGFTYRMVHIGPELVADVIADRTGRPAGPPLFADPIVADPALAQALRALHRALLGKAAALRRDELLSAAVVAMMRRGAARPPGSGRSLTSPDVARIAARAREVLDAGYRDEITAADLADAADAGSRFALYRAFQTAYGMAPSDYQRQRRLQAARTLVAQGHPVAAVAADVGFADQSHLTRWFTRYFGLTPGAYRRAAGVEAPSP